MAWNPIQAEVGFELPGSPSSSGASRNPEARLPDNQSPVQRKKPIVKINPSRGPMGLMTDQEIEVRSAHSSKTATSGASLVRMVYGPAPNAYGYYF